jgi:hypothetical protein
MEVLSGGEIDFQGQVKINDSHPSEIGFRNSRDFDDSDDHPGVYCWLRFGEYVDYYNDSSLWLFLDGYCKSHLNKCHLKEELTKRFVFMIGPSTKEILSLGRKALKNQSSH